MIGDTGDPRFAELVRITRELKAAEVDVTGWRDKRNDEILRLRQLEDPPGIAQIAAAAGVRHGYVSRIVQGEGRPASGHEQRGAAG